MKQHPVESLINKADTAINQEDFDTLTDIYADDAVLVIRPGMNAVGKVQIRKAFEAIAAHFEHTLNVRQAGIKILETGDTALVLSKTLVSAKLHPIQERKATYVFRKDANGAWLCAIDNSYGHDLLDA
ncbi:SgcJ/EcaC family oxidoreductase [uncultured Methanolobus sp.]|uniref:YybH family protein n=1 Tax=uncultured Methanolobus sp. TaxID=218300 RepID=UPI002AAB48B7|nr:SgcJ/EcaC family oxidoreductase [uncultured Methanolobus sp.]